MAASHALSCCSPSRPTPQKLQPPLRMDGLLSFLTKAARNSWELPTSQVQLLVGAKPRGSTFSRYGFTFRPAGKHGQETSWRVER